MPQSPAVLAPLALMVVWPLTAAGAPAAPPSRPIAHAAIEVNPLALLAGRIGGQVQVGVAGPLTIVGGLSRVTLPDNQGYDSGLDEAFQGPFGNPRLAGWAFEVGPRVYLPLLTASKTVRIDGLLSALYLNDLFHEGGIAADRWTPPTSARAIYRQGLAIDAGLQWTVRDGFYLLAGLGYQFTDSNPRPSARSNHLYLIPAIGPTTVQRKDAWPRLLLSLGWSF